MVILLIIMYGKHRGECKKIVLPIVIVSVALAVFYFAFTLWFSQEKIRSYYLVLPLIGLANVVQLIKAFAAVKMCRVKS